MRRLPPRFAVPAALAVGAILLGGTVLAVGEGTAANLLSFAAWAAALLSLFALGLALPPRLARSRRAAALWNLALAGAALAAAWLADAAVYRRDVHVDLSRERANTPPPQLEAVVDGLKAELTVTYFYNSADENALRAKALLEIAARQNGRFHLRAVDLDQEPATARRFGVRAYDTAVVEAEGRRVVVENTADTAQIAYAALRALKRRSDLVCFVAGHGEAVSTTPPHLHYSHVEDLKGHDAPGSGDVLVGPADGLDRLQLALTMLGYAARPVVLATLAALPQDCAMVAEVGPRRPYAPGEAALLAAYLARGGRLLLMIDPAFAIGPELGGLLSTIGLASEPAMVIDTLNHYGADATKVAVPYYPPHPITDRVAMTVFPEARPLRLERVPDGIRAAPLATSSTDSHLRPVAVEGEEASPGAPATSERHPELLAAAFEGLWPDASLHPQKPFRLVVVGNSSFASNAYFPYVSNGELAVGMVRWLAGDEDTPAGGAAILQPGAGRPDQPPDAGHLPAGRGRAAAGGDCVRRHGLVAAAMMAGRGFLLALGLAAAATALLGTLAITGKPPGGAMLERFEPRGIVAADPIEISRVELRAGADRFAFHRGADGRWRSGTEGEAGLADDLTEHLETALRFLHVSTPMRILRVEDTTSLADFGLEPPAYAVSLGAAGKPAAADFGALNPAQTSQYVRLVGDPSVYLLPRHVGAEWRLVADLARRNLPRDGAARPLLGVSMDEVWAVEIALGGTLHRFERDRFGQWFLHVGQHVHAAGDPGHLADPAKAPIIAAAFAMLGEARADAVQDTPTESDARFGLDRPRLILLFYPRDSSTPLARLDVGAWAENGFSRYVRSSQSDEIVTVAADAPERLVDLLRAVGAVR